MPRKKNKRKKKNAAAVKGGSASAPPVSGGSAGESAEDRNSSDARSWHAQRTLLKAMHKNIIEQKGGKTVSGFERHMVEGMKATADGDFDEAHRRLEMMVREGLDPYIFAILDIDEERGVYRRIYSSRPDELPVTDDRPLQEGPWQEYIVKQRKLMYNSRLTTMPWAPDIAEGLAIGCQCVSYMPVAGDEETEELLGVLVLLAKDDCFDSGNAMFLVEKRTHIWLYMNTMSLARKFGTSGEDDSAMASMLNKLNL